MSTPISEMKSGAVFFGNIKNNGRTQKVQNKDNFSEIFDKTQNPTDTSKKDDSVKTDVSSKSDDAQSIQNHANIQKNKASEQVKEQTEGVKDVKGEEELEVAVVEAAGEMVQKIADAFQVTVEEVESVLESLGLTSVDLLNTENLTNVVLALNPECDALSLMTNEELYSDLKSLMDAAQGLKGQIAQDFNLTEEDMSAVLDAAKEKMNMQIPIEIVPQNAETAVTVETVVTEEHSHRNNLEMLGSAEYDGTVIPKPENTQSIKNESSETREDSSYHGEHNFNQNFVDKLADAVENTNSTGTTSYGVRGQDIINQITEQIRVHVKQDTTEMELQLHPASLGSVKVQITSAGGVLNAVFTTENEAVKAALESQLIQLKDNFTEQGLKVESVEVNVSAQGFERSLDQQEQEQNRFEDSRSKKGNRRIRLNSLEDAENILAEDISADDRIVADMMIRNGNTVDYTV